MSEKTKNDFIKIFTDYYTENKKMLFGNRYNVLKKIETKGKGEDFLVYDSFHKGEKALKILNIKIVDDKNDNIGETIENSNIAYECFYANILTFDYKSFAIVTIDDIKYRIDFLTYYYEPARTLKTVIYATSLHFKLQDIVIILNLFRRFFNYLEKENISHNNLSPDNVYIGNNLLVLHPSLLRDEKNLSEEEKLQKMKYMPYEQIIDGVKNRTNDLYAFGIIIYEAFLRATPFERTKELGKYTSSTNLNKLIRSYNGGKILKDRESRQKTLKENKEKFSNGYKTEVRDKSKLKSNVKSKEELLKAIKEQNFYWPERYIDCKKEIFSLFSLDPKKRAFNIKLIRNAIKVSEREYRQSLKTSGGYKCYSVRPKTYISHWIIKLIKQYENILKGNYFVYHLRDAAYVYLLACKSEKAISFYESYLAHMREIFLLKYNSQKATELFYNDIYTLLKNKKYKIVKRNLENFVINHVSEYKSSKTLALYMLGDFAYKKKVTRKPALYYEQAIKKDNDLSEIIRYDPFRYNRVLNFFLSHAHYFYEIGRYQKAIEYYEYVLKLDEFSFQAHIGLCLCYLHSNKKDKNNFDLARKMLLEIKSKGIEIKNETCFHNLENNIILSMGDIPQNEFKMSHSFFGSFQVYFYNGVLKYAENKYIEALDFFMKYVYSVRILSSYVQQKGKKPDLSFGKEDFLKALNYQIKDVWQINHFLSFEESVMVAECFLKVNNYYHAFVFFLFALRNISKNDNKTINYSLLDAFKNDAEYDNYMPWFYKFKIIPNYLQEDIYFKLATCIEKLGCVNNEIFATDIIENSLGIKKKTDYRFLMLMFFENIDFCENLFDIYLKTAIAGISYIGFNFLNKYIYELFFLIKDQKDLDFKKFDFLVKINILPINLFKIVLMTQNIYVDMKK